MKPKFLPDLTMKKDTWHELCSEDLMNVSKYHTITYWHKCCKVLKYENLYTMN